MTPDDTAQLRTLDEIMALISRLGSGVAGSIIREQGEAGNKLCQSFLYHAALPHLHLPNMMGEYLKWTTMAAEGGEAEAQFNLGQTHYQLGREPINRGSR